MSLFLLVFCVYILFSTKLKKPTEHYFTFEILKHDKNFIKHEQNFIKHDKNYIKHDKKFIKHNKKFLGDEQAAVAVAEEAEIMAERVIVYRPPFASNERADKKQ